MSKSRTWDIANESKADTARQEQANMNILYQAAVNAGGGNWSVTRASEVHGGNRNLALAMLESRGNTSPDEKTIKSQMRNLQRYQQFEKTGVKGPNSNTPKKAQGTINRAGVAKSLNGKGASFRASSGGNGGSGSSSSISVAGYERDDRDITDTLTNEQAIEFLSNPNWDTLADAYGVGELHGYGDVNVEIFL